MKNMVSLNYANCIDSLVGERGLSTEEIKAIQSRITRAHEAITAKKREGKLGFMELPYNTAEAREIKNTAKKLSEKYDTFVVIGIGGSALGNIALQQALRHPFWNLQDRKSRKKGMRLFVPDNVDPDLIAGLVDVLDFKKTVFNVVSKSGSTAECLANYFILKKILKQKVGKKYAQQLVISTDIEKGYLRETADKEGIKSFVIPKNVGGRFSVLSPVGLLSAACTGIDVEKLLNGASSMAQHCSNDDVFHNPAAMYAVIQYLYYWKGRPMSVMMPYSNALYGIADWYRQLWAESLGKKVNRKGETVYVGPTPIKALGATDQHSQAQLYIEGPHDKVITFLSVDQFGATMPIPSFDKHYLGGHSLFNLIKAEEDATRLALTREGRPNLTISLPSITPEAIGQVLYMLELATAYAGELLDIDAFNQPGVELGKQLTYALMGRIEYEQLRSEIEPKLAESKKQTYSI
jgi:glucose-6-phosphate isomerase